MKGFYTLCNCGMIQRNEWIWYEFNAALWYHSEIIRRERREVEPQCRKRLLRTNNNTLSKKRRGGVSCRKRVDQSPKDFEWRQQEPPFFSKCVFFFFFRTGLLCISSLKVSQSPNWLVQLCFASHLRHYNQQNKHHHLSFFSLFKLCELFFQVIQRPNAHSLFQLQEFSIIRVVLIKGEEKRQNDADWYQHDGPTVLHRLPIPR